MYLAGPFLARTSSTSSSKSATFGALPAVAELVLAASIMRTRCAESAIIGSKFSDCSF